MMNKAKNIFRSLFIIGGILLSSSLSAKKKTEVAKRPNVIIINVDDVGYGDPSCYGGTLFQTPNIDRLAREGVKFTDGYVSAPVCSPSRHGLLTGTYQQRFGIQWNHDTWNMKHREGERVVPVKHKHIDQAFADAGYVTAMAGKINMEDFPKTTFNQQFSVTSSGSHYFPDEKGKYAGVDGAPKPKGGWTMTQWGPEREGEEYLTDRCGRQCIEFMDEHKETPFFFYLAFNAPHTPLHAKKVDKPRVAHIQSEAAKLYAAMVLAIDDNVGRILDYLDKSKLRENTIVVFLSDNGPANPVHLSIPKWWPKDSPYHVLGQRGPLSGFKGNFWEAGIRIPYIISWPSQLESGVEYQKPVSTLDIYPTMCAAADVKLPENTTLDGVNLMPYLKGNYTEDPHKALFWYANRMGAARMGKWKFLVEDGVHYLFDLENDIAEKNNVMKENPEVMTEIFEAFIDFRNEMPAYRNPFRRPIDIPSPDVLKLPVIDPK
ncbi:sulfatase-like hydrolase/transferase [Saccharicrinis sp. GN24d3]|uniref:sulfatase-like hydrolase/transferase n=1 Tax=Saccharicrinis sp. GN24d3 TaxID=3458416 RepID=UPI004036DD33